MATKSRSNKETTSGKLKQNRSNSIIGYILRIFDRIIEYFETLLVYFGKIIRQKVKDVFLLFFLLFIFSIFIFGMIVFLSAGLFFYILQTYSGNYMLACFTMGGVYFLILIVVFIFVSGKLKKIL
ncbi:MAG: hypothetical protein L6Q54_06220 [Leptospiraceae bacterium]|nr:hypothetical protein [Leptospiraceae bacterium]MCK6380832.1 hypothetical protein [Leptospiraceae bacterium]NUM40783.1 hypothetical protein [Leptospiraceae bacterium]